MSFSAVLCALVCCDGWLLPACVWLLGVRAYGIFVCACECLRLRKVLLFSAGMFALGVLLWLRGVRICAIARARVCALSVAPEYQAHTRASFCDTTPLRLVGDLRGPSR